MFDKIKFAKNFAQHKHFLREYRKTNNDKYLKKADYLEGKNKFIQIKYSQKKNITYCASLNLHK